MPGQDGGGCCLRAPLAPPVPSPGSTCRGSGTGMKRVGGAFARCVMPALAQSLVRSAVLAAVIGPAAYAQNYPERIGEMYGDGAVWIAALKSVEPDGSVTWAVPDLAQVDPWTAKVARKQIDDFKSRFGSIADHGLEDLSYPPLRFCTDEDLSDVATIPDVLPRSVDGALLLSEVAVTATVSEIVPGFSGMGGPMAMLHLSDVSALTSRSPIPDYALVHLKRMVIDGTVFCDRDLGVDYKPGVGDRVVVIGSWFNGVVPQGYLTGGIFRRIAPGGTIDPLPWQTIRSLDALQGNVDRLESKGLLAETAQVARALYSKERSTLSQAVDRPTAGGARCRVDNLSTFEDGSWTVEFDCEQLVADAQQGCDQHNEPRDRQAHQNRLTSRSRRTLGRTTPTVRTPCQRSPLGMARLRSDLPARKASPSLRAGHRTRSRENDVGSRRWRLPPSSAGFASLGNT